MAKVELDTKPLTKTQISTLKYLIKSIKSGYTPSIRDICSEFDISSTNGAASRIAALERKGFISKIPGSSRSIKIERNLEGEYLKDDLLQTTEELLDIIEARGEMDKIKARCVTEVTLDLMLELQEIEDTGAFDAD